MFTIIINGGFCLKEVEHLTEKKKSLREGREYLFLNPGQNISPQPSAWLVERTWEERRVLGFWTHFRGANICSLLCESGGLGPQSDRQYWRGLARVFFSLLFSLKIIYSIFFSCNTSPLKFAPYVFLCFWAPPLGFPYSSIQEDPLQGDFDC